MLEIDDLEAEHLAYRRKKFRLLVTAELHGGFGEPHSGTRSPAVRDTLKLFVGVYSGGLQQKVSK